MNKPAPLNLQSLPPATLASAEIWQFPRAETETQPQKGILAFGPCWLLWDFSTQKPF